MVQLPLPQVVFDIHLLYALYYLLWAAATQTTYRKDKHILGKRKLFCQIITFKYLKLVVWFVHKQTWQYLK